jgi:rRNA-processing protein FCF1
VNPWSSDLAGFADRLTRCAGLLIDTNLLVLLVVGSVNPQRIAQFKRTRQYSAADYRLLLRIASCFEHWFTVAHVMAEVSNLTDLNGIERRFARIKLKEVLATIREPWISSNRAAETEPYQAFGLADAAIITAAREHGLAVLTSDLDLYRKLCAEDIPALNFAHLQEMRWSGSKTH